MLNNICPPFVHKCLVDEMFQCTNRAQEHLLTNISVNCLCTNGQQMVDRNHLCTNVPVVQ